MTKILHKRLALIKSKNPVNKAVSIPNIPFDKLSLAQLDWLFNETNKHIKKRLINYNYENNTKNR